MELLKTTSYILGENFPSLDNKKKLLKKNFIFWDFLILMELSSSKLKKFLILFLKKHFLHFRRDFPKTQAY